MEADVNARLVITFCLVIALVSACGPIPLSQVKLESLLVQKGDLPVGFTGAQVRDTAPGMFAGLPTADNTIYQQFARGGNPAGGIAVFLYADESSKRRAYDEILSGMGSDAKPIFDIGDQASMVISLDFVAADLVFTRCKSVVHVRFGGTSNVDEIQSYARRLDTRLSKVVCR
jgi:hypothetical protein